MGDSSKWEYMLPSNDKPLLLLPKDNLDNEDDNIDNFDEDKIEDLEKHLDLPPSWVSPIKITPKGK